MAIQIVCDSTGGFSTEDLNRLRPTILPLTVNFANGDSMIEGQRETYPPFYTRLIQEIDLPTTSQPAVGEVIEAFSRILSNGDDIIAICLSEKLSGTYGSFCAAAKSLDPSRIRIVDCKCCSVGVKFLVEFARQLIDAGATLDEIESTLSDQATRNSAIMVVDDLKFLKKGGRVGNAGFLVGKLLNIHPILMMKNGALMAHAKVRGMRNVYDRMIQELPEKMKLVTVLHCVNEEGARLCISKIKNRFGNININLEDLSPVIGTHLGNGSVGIIFCW